MIFCQEFENTSIRFIWSANFIFILFCVHLVQMNRRWSAQRLTFIHDPRLPELVVVVSVLVLALNKYIPVRRQTTPPSKTSPRWISPIKTSLLVLIVPSAVNYPRLTLFNANNNNKIRPRLPQHSVYHHRYRQMPLMRRRQRVSYLLHQHRGRFQLRTTQQRWEVVVSPFKIFSLIS